MRIVPPESVGLSSERLRRVDQHLLSRYIEPRMRHAGLTEAQITTIRTLNPRRLLDI